MCQSSFQRKFYLNAIFALCAYLISNPHIKCNFTAGVLTLGKTTDSLQAIKQSQSHLGVGDGKLLFYLFQKKNNDSS